MRYVPITYPVPIHIVQVNFVTQKWDYKVLNAVSIFHLLNAMNLFQRKRMSHDNSSIVQRFQRAHTHSEITISVNAPAKI